MSWRNIFLQNPRWQVPLQLVLQIVLGHVFFFVRAHEDSCARLFVHVCAQAGGVKALNRRPLTNQIIHTQGVRKAHAFQSCETVLLTVVPSPIKLLIPRG